MRYILLFIHALTIAIYQFFFVDPVTVTTNFPASAKPGSQFVGEITIIKGALSGFAKFQIELPEGFTAEESDSKGGTFSLAGQTAKIIWTSVPSSSEITIKVLIKVSASASGDKNITGKYSYIENNVKQQVDLTPIVVKIESETVASTSTETTSTTEPVTTNTTAPSTSSVTPDYQANTNAEVTAPVVSVARTITAGKSPNIFEVELKIKKDGAKGFAKLQEKIPSGYMAVGEKAAGSTFAFSSADHVAKFIWTSLPAEEELLVTYKIMPKQGDPREQPAFVEGEFNYLDNQDSKKAMVPREELATGTSSEPVVTNTEPVKTETVATTEPTKTETVAATEPVTGNVKPPKSGSVTYVVQVGAFKNGVNAGALSKKYSLSGVRTEMHEGYTKCIYGKFGEYKEARDSRENAKAKGVSDAFVAAYNSAQRITVQEALMITSQKWYR